MRLMRGKDEKVRARYSKSSKKGIEEAGIQNPQDQRQTEGGIGNLHKEEKGTSSKAPRLPSEIDWMQQRQKNKPIASFGQTRSEFEQIRVFHDGLCQLPFGDRDKIIGTGT